MKIVWDLDGVLRDLNGYIMKLYGGGYPDSWDFVGGSGMGVTDTINANLAILSDAPPTAYLSVLKKHNSYPEIWTAQPPHWQELTKAWVMAHIGTCTLRFIKPKEKEILLYKEEDTILIEDSPNFKDYDRVLLIDRPYNQRVKALRIYGTKNLNNMINTLKGI